MPTPIVEIIPAIYKGSVFASRTSGMIFRAVKLNAVNIRCLAMDGKTWNVPWSNAREATADETKRFEGWEASRKVEPLSTDSLLRIGNVVKFRNPSGASQLGLHVVSKSTPNGWSLVRLGGDPGSRYFRGVPAQLLEKVEMGTYEIKNV